jgi:hypothetical protein
VLTVIGSVSLPSSSFVRLVVDLGTGSATQVAGLPPEVDVQA